MTQNYPKLDMHRTGQNIKRIMQQRGMTVRNMQEYLKLSTPQSIYHWFEGHNLPSLDNLYALSELFQVSVDEMLCGNRNTACYIYDSAFYNRMQIYYNRMREIFRSAGGVA